MALQEAPPSGRSPPRTGRSKSQVAHPECPKCSRRMTVKQVIPVLFAPNVDDIVYGCEDCGTEIKRASSATERALLDL